MGTNHVALLEIMLTEFDFFNKLCYYENLGQIKVRLYTRCAIPSLAVFANFEAQSISKAHSV
jgi:hypothetical protein